MFRIVCDPSSGSVKRAWLKLLVIFFVCVVGVWQRNYDNDDRYILYGLYFSKVAVFVPQEAPLQTHCVCIPVSMYTAHFTRRNSGVHKFRAPGSRRRSEYISYSDI